MSNAIHQAISVYAPNLVKRKDRKLSILKEFRNKNEFNFKVVPAIEHKIGAFGLWQTFVEVVKNEKNRGSEYFIFCEDDHVFLSNYTFTYLCSCIRKADSLKADILSGGMAWIDSPIQCNKHLFWVNNFNGSQFIVVFNRFYDIILSSSNLNEGFILDMKLSELSDNLFVMYPFISVQKEFGYSDVTSQNNQNGYIQNLFEKAERLLYILDEVSTAYNV